MGEVGRAAEHLDGALAAGQQRVGVEEADRAQPVGRVLEQQPGDLAADLAGAEHEGAVPDACPAERARRTTA